MSQHLYVHIPFCSHRCGYCAFVTVTGHDDLHGPYLEAVMAEHRLLSPSHPGPYDTIFIGGGTPTRLDPTHFARLIEWLAGLLAPGGELTSEANPETVTPDHARILAAANARVSLGVQSFDADRLDLLDRSSGPAEVATAVERLRGAGVSNLSCDLIWGTPGQDAAGVQEDVEAIVSLGPDHVSAYELEVKPGTRLHHELGGAPDPAEDDDLYAAVVDTLEDAGYRWYELANFARPGRESRHNRAYWTQQDYLGIGIGAVSTLGATRTTNRPGIRRYLEALAAGKPPPATEEPITAATRTFERVMLATRLAEPVDLAGSGADMAAAERMARHGLLTLDGDSITLRRRGRMLQSAVVAELFA